MRFGILAFCVVALVAKPASAQFLRPKCTPVAPLNCPPGTDPYLGIPSIGSAAQPGTNPADPNNPNAANPDAANPNAFAQGGEGGGTAQATFNDGFNGDFCGIFVTRRVLVGYNVNGQTINSGGGVIPGNATPVFRTVVVASTSRYNGTLITDNDGPRPMDRVYMGYNYYNGIGTSVNTGFDRVDMHRETIGFEKTLLDGNASIGLRLPFIQLAGPPGVNQNTFGDLSVIFKYAFYNDRRTGDLLSAGLMVTTPTGTGDDRPFADGSLATQSVLFQPFAGGVKSFGEGRGFVQGLTSLVVPTDNRDPLLFNNSVGVGYALYQNVNDRFINAVVPTFETHIRTPLNHRNLDAPTFFQDQVNLTAGVQFRTDRATISPAFCVPLVRPQAYNSEFMIAMNLRY